MTSHDGATLGADGWDAESARLSKRKGGVVASTIGRWIDALEPAKGVAFWITYCALFALMLCCMCASFLHAGTSFIWIDDGLTQQYTVFIELGDWLRQLLWNVFIAHSFEVPMWTSELGYGQDYYLWISMCFGDPIDWIAIFATEEMAELLLNLTVPITLFLAGIAYVKLGRYHGNDGFSILLGTMAFLFSGVSIIAFNQIFLLYPMLLAPMLILGADKVIDGRSPALFIITVALFGFYSFTNLWMACLLLFAYCLIRFAFLEGRSWRLFMKLLLKMLGCLALGICMSAVALLPNVIAILSLDRVGLERPWDVLYPFEFYIQVAKGFVAFNYAGSECFIGFLSLSVISVASLLASRKDDAGKMLAIMFLVLTAVLLLPVLGKVMNGFAYPNNRWVWMYALLMGYVTTYMAPQLQKGVLASSKRMGIAVLCCIIAFMVLGVFADNVYCIPIALLLALFVLLLYARGVVLQVGLVVSLVFSCGALYWLWGSHYHAAERNVPIGQAHELALSRAVGAAEHLDGDGRFDAVGAASPYRNTSCVTDEDGVTFYNSVYNGSIDDYHSHLGLTASPLNFSVQSMSGRSIMEQMANVRYVIADEREGHLVPALYGKDSASVSVDGMTIDRADVSIPFATLFEHDIKESTFRELSPVDAQEALLQGVVLEDDECERVTTDLKSMNDPLGFGYQLFEQVDASDPSAEKGSAAPTLISSGTADDGVLRDLGFQSEGRASLHLDVDIPADAEAYVVIEGLDHEPEPALSSKATLVERIGYKLRSIFPLPDNGCSVTVAASDRSEGVWQTGKDAHLYSGKDTWAFNLGTSGSAREGIDITFEGSGRYEIRELSVCVEDSAAVKSSIREMGDDAAVDAELSGNAFSCTATVEGGSKTLLVLLPYSQGWSTTVDGQPVETLKADLGFMAVQLDEGSHSVVMRYETPGVVLGAVISLSGFLIFIAVMIVRRRRIPKEPREGR